LVFKAHSLVRAGFDFENLGFSVQQAYETEVIC